MTPSQGLRLGNFLYLWQRAHLKTAQGTETRVLESPALKPWLTAFPALRTLTLPRNELRFSDRREWDNVFLYQRFGIDFTAEDMSRFVDDVLAPRITDAAAGTLFVNVRRGDYYQAEHVEKYAFDQIGYISEALASFDDIRRIRIVSDDDAWCRANLDSLARTATPDVAYDAPHPLGNFLAIASARLLIGSNSTFSYWGGYVATVRHADAQVVMPRFHGRMGGGRTDAHQLDPRWTAIAGHAG